MTSICYNTSFSPWGLTPAGCRGLEERKVAQTLYSQSVLFDDELKQGKGSLRTQQTNESDCL